MYRQVEIALACLCSCHVGTPYSSIHTIQEFVGKHFLFEKKSKKWNCKENVLDTFLPVNRFVFGVILHFFCIDVDFAFPLIVYFFVCCLFFIGHIEQSLWECLRFWICTAVPFPKSSASKYVIISLILFVFERETHDKHNIYLHVPWVSLFISGVFVNFFAFNI